VLGLLFSGSCLAGCLSEGRLLSGGSLVAMCAAFSFCAVGGVDALESRSRRPRTSPARISEEVRERAGAGDLDDPADLAPDRVDHPGAGRATPFLLRALLGCAAE
jgi:hypothetical protein